MRFILDIQLVGIEEPIVRRKLAVPGKLTFHHLHLMIQAAMGWEHQHLYSFSERMDTKYFTIVSPYAEEFGADGTKIPAQNILWSYLNQHLPTGDPGRDKLYYLYDYGDYWMHGIDIVDYDRSNRTSTELLEAEGACPPENCGGIPGFQLLKDYLSGKITKKEYYDHLIAVDTEGYNLHKIDLHRLKLRVKDWRVMEEDESLRI